ncbi:hypothetical protein Ancab_014215 [Ancistrocladus abbreviatus]
MESNGDSATGAFFPVVFFDGVREIDLGNVLVQSSMNFKGFQSLMSQKIGISPHQITIWFGKKINSSISSSFKSGDYRKIPVTNKFNFASIISGHRNWFFQVVLKRNRRNRRRRAKQSIDEDDAYSIHSEITSPDNFILLRRNPNSPVFPYNDGIRAATPMDVAPDNWSPGSEYLDYANRMKILERERERYLMSLNLNSNVYSDFNIYGGKSFYGGRDRMSDDGASSSGGERERMMMVCDVCMNYSKTIMEEDETHETVPFHWCKFDAVTVGFRSPAGPIARPSKSEL